MQPDSHFDTSFKMLNLTLQRGLVPITFIMNEATANRIADDIESLEDKQRSALVKLWRRIAKKKGRDKLAMLHGVPVTLAPHIPDGGMYLQTSNPNAGQALAEVLKRGSAGQQAQARSMEGYADLAQSPEGPQRGERQANALNPQPAADPAPTLEDIANSKFSDRPSVSDVLIRSLESADELSGVAVVRVTKDGRVKDIYTNIDQLSLQGALQHAQALVMYGGQQ